MGTWWVLPQLPWGVGLRTVGQWGPSVPKAAQVTSAAREGPSSAARMLDLALGGTSTEPWWVRCCPVCPDTAQGLLLPLPSSLHWAPGAAGPAPALPRPCPGPSHSARSSAEHMAPALGSLHCSAAGPQRPDPAPSRGTTVAAPPVAATQINRFVLPARNPTGQTVTPTPVPGQFGAVNWGRNLVFRGLGNWFCSCLTTMSSATSPQPQSSVGSGHKHL